ncbi:MAG: glutathione S-transferase family protein [Rhodospirillaceae bacterium]
MAITLYNFGPLMGVPDPSPFCFKLEIYLRMAGLEYTVSSNRQMKAPSGKRPFIIDENGKLMADSGLIIAALEARSGHPVDGKLTLMERAESLAFQRLMDEHLYWAIVYGRWLDPHGLQQWLPYMKEILPVPGLLFGVIKPLVKRIVRSQLHGHGIGRHKPETIWKLAIDDVRALSHWLGQRQWGFGEQPTVLDATLASYVGELICQPWDNPLVIETRKHRNLVSHFGRMMSRYYPELEIPKNT